jgi:hypothetical protein
VVAAVVMVVVAAGAVAVVTVEVIADRANAKTLFFRRPLSPAGAFSSRQFLLVKRLLRVMETI